MKYYEKKYENVFKRDLDKRCDLDKISVYKKTPGDVDEYARVFRETYMDSQQKIFDYLVKLEWLNRRFIYNGKRSIKKHVGNTYLLRARSLFIRNYVGFDPRLFFISSSPFSAIARYFDEIFPKFVEMNPFEEELKFPFKYVGMSAMVLVGQMDERMELLTYAEGKKMDLETFKDYVVNYINCYNEEHGPTYEFKFPGSYMNYVSVIKKREKIRKKGVKIKGKYKK